MIAFALVDATVPNLVLVALATAISVLLFALRMRKPKPEALQNTRSSPVVVSIILSTNRAKSVSPTRH